ncbi:MAG: DUF4136 domain-containing protein [Gemmatimonadota bacterium]
MKKTTLLTAALTVALAACGGGLSVNSDWDSSFDFRAPQTFTVLDNAGGPLARGLNDARVKQSIASVMESKGFRQVADTSQADIAVGYQFTTEQQRSYNTVNTGWSGYGYGGYGSWYPYYYGPSMATSRTTETVYDVGSLLIAVFDTDARAMVYASTGSRTLDEQGRSPEEMQERIDDAVSQILADFPPGT